jgi:hypothetical protein
MMFRIPWPFRRGLGRSGPMGFGGAHLRRDIGMDDWEGSIGTADPDRLWPPPSARGPGPQAVAPSGRRIAGP